MENLSHSVANGFQWKAQLLSILMALFLVLDGTMKLFRVPAAMDATEKLGYPESVVPRLGVLLLICTLLYLIPRTSTLGAILLTAYLGGAVASHLRLGAMSQAAFAASVGALIWVGAWLRGDTIRQIFPFLKS